MSKLNVGCARFIIDGWINQDVREYPGVKIDLVCNVLNLKLEDESIDAVYCGHVLEHLYRKHVLRALSEIHRVLKPGCEAMFVGPDTDRAKKLYPDDAALLESLIVGGWPDSIPEHQPGHNPGDFHKWEATEENTLALIKEVFPDCKAIPIADVSTEWPVVGRQDWQCAIGCRKGK